MTDGPAGLSAHEFERIRILFCGIMLLPVLSASESSKTGVRRRTG
jgi:hypothetical protein